MCRNHPFLLGSRNHFLCHLLSNAPFLANVISRQRAGSTVVTRNAIVLWIFFPSIFLILFISFHCSRPLKHHEHCFLMTFSEDVTLPCWWCPQRQVLPWECRKMQTVHPCPPHITPMKWELWSPWSGWNVSFVHGMCSSTYGTWKSTFVQH